MNPPRSNSGANCLEVMVAVFLIGILITLLSLPRHGPRPSELPLTLNHLRQLHSAAQMMALDGIVSENPQVGWPGDIGGTFSNWATQLLTNNYLTTNDFCKLLSTSKLIVTPSQMFRMDTTAVRVYNVNSKSAASTVFLSSANFTNTPTAGIIPTEPASGSTNFQFVVFRKGGDGGILLPKRAGNTNAIGDFAPLCR